MKVIDTTSARLAYAMAEQLAEWTGRPAEEWLQAANDGWRELMRSGRVFELQTAFGTIRFIKNRFLPDDVVLNVRD